MTKVALISDIHIGIRSDSHHFLENQRNFFENIFFPECEKRNIKTVINCGDLFDRRKYINFTTLNRAKKFLFDNIEKHSQVWYNVIGNHDSYYRNTIEYNSLKELSLELQLENFHIIDTPQEIELYDEKLCFIPWICDSNEQVCMSKIKNSKARYCFGHFGINGFELTKGRIYEEGLDSSIFSSYDQVFSGHFHKSSHKGNIYYLGSIGQYTWNDYGDERGFYIFDLKDNELEFIPNNSPMFTKIEYDDSRNISKVNLEAIQNSFCKVVIKNQNDKNKFKKFMDSIDTTKLVDLKIVDQTQETLEDKEIANEEIEDTKTILKKYSEDDKNLRNLLFDIHSEALMLE